MAANMNQNLTRIGQQSKHIHPRVRGKRQPWEFKEYLPLKLNNSVSFKGGYGEEFGQFFSTLSQCTKELALLMDCMKLNEFDDKKCVKEAQLFNVCNSESTAKRREIKQQRQLGTLKPGAKTLSPPQMNKLLGMFPQKNADVPERWP